MARMRTTLPPDQTVVQIRLSRELHARLKAQADRRGYKFYPWLQKLLAKASEQLETATG